jgi:glycogen operon protein
VLQGLYNGAAISEQSVLIVVNGSAGAVDVTLPAAPGVTAYVLLWDSADERPAPPSDPVEAGGCVSMAAASMRVWSSTGA